MQQESARLYDLNPVNFVYNSDRTETKQYGLIAEEVKEVFPELVVNEQDGTPLTVRYDMLPVLLLNEMKKLVARVEVLEEALRGLWIKLESFFLSIKLLTISPSNE